MGESLSPKKIGEILVAECHCSHNFRQKKIFCLESNVSIQCVHALATLKLLNIHTDDMVQALEVEFA